MPILGTGFGLLPQPRTDIIQEIIKSFVAACSERTLCEILTIVITPKDWVTHDISLSDLESFLQHECTYNIYPGNSRAPTGKVVLRGKRGYGSVCKY